MTALHKSVARPTPSLHNRYTRHWTENSKLYKKISLALAFIQNTQMLFEMAVRKRSGEKGRWKLIVLLEGFKCDTQLSY